jgi:hypothetical protein
MLVSIQDTCPSCITVLSLLYTNYTKMYLINSNSPLLETRYAVSESATNTFPPSAALNTDGGLAPVNRRIQRTRGRSRASKSPLSVHHALLPEPEPCLFQKANSRNILVACWGAYHTLAHLRASPYYMRIDFPARCNIQGESERRQKARNEGHAAMIPNTTPAGSLCPCSEREEPAQIAQGLTMHVVLPIPKYYLQNLTRSQHDFLYGCLIGKRFRPGGEISQRVEETLEAIGEVIEK